MMFFVVVFFINNTKYNKHRFPAGILCATCETFFFRESIIENEVWHLHKISELFSSQGQKWRNACTTCRFGTDFLFLMRISL